MNSHNENFVDDNFTPGEPYFSDVEIFDICMCASFLCIEQEKTSWMSFVSASKSLRDSDFNILTLDDCYTRTVIFNSIMVPSVFCVF